MSIINPSILPGFMELLPEEQKQFDTIKNIVESNFQKYGFVNIDTPLIEKEEILLSKGGGETTKQIYKINKESTPQALRFDLTVSLARYVSMYAHNLSFPFRRYQIGKVYRGERNQKGRYREFYQCDIDIIGNEKLSIINDGEIPSVIYNIFKDLGYEELILFRINNRKLLSGFLESISVSDFESVLRTIDKLEKIGKENTKNELLKLNIAEDKIEEIFNFIENKETNLETIEFLNGLEINNDKFIEGRAELIELFNYMKKFAIPEDAIKIDLTITRGLDYYTGTVIETFLKGYESIGSVCSGGRYEDLANNFTKKKYPGIGLSIGLTRLYYQLNEASLIRLEKEENKNILVLPMDETVFDYSIEIVNYLRENNIKSQIYLEQGKAKKKFNYADKIGVKTALIIGEQEKNNKTISVKDFNNGNQVEIELNKLLEYIGG